MNSSASSGQSWPATRTEQVRSFLREGWTWLWEGMTSPRLLLASFFCLIVAGTVGLKTLPGLYTGEGLSWLDALYTATSAVCVTGLIVVDTATYFTLWGQAFILLLIQLGGLGILTFATLVLLAVGRRLTLHHETMSAEMVELVPDLNTRRMVRDLVVFTFTLEGVGALALFLGWVGFPRGKHSGTPSSTPSAHSAMRDSARFLTP